MREPSSYPAGVPCWIDTAQPEPRDAADFYRGLFGWEYEQHQPSRATGPYLVATIGDTPVAAITTPADDLSRAPQWTSYVRVDAVDDAVAAITATGGHTLVGPVDQADAGRRVVCADTDGAMFGVVQTPGPLVAQRVNEPGTWNFSELLTPTPDRAIAFYRQVFGWEADLVDLGSGDTWMWRRPGYGDVLEQHEPGVRKRHVDFGAPPGFTDAVAWLSPPAPEQPADTAPSWHITFTVADADAVAARAEELGGAVLVPPTDIGVVRTAVLRDPQGATFTASKFDPS
jgi:predicted enzyme related to lactoylglutathione lyase